MSLPLIRTGTIATTRRRRDKDVAQPPRFLVDPTDELHGRHGAEVLDALSAGHHRHCGAGGIINIAMIATIVIIAVGGIIIAMRSVATALPGAGGREGKARLERHGWF